MAKITRFTQKIFGSSAGVNQITEFGSTAAGSTVYTTVASAVQTLSNYLTGWFGAVIGGNSPCIEDMNALFFMITTVLAYLMQEGVPEYDAGTTYYIGSLALDSTTGVVYQSLTDNNIGNALTSNSNWQVQGNNVSTVTANTAISAHSQFLRSDSTSGALTHTLPQISGTPLGAEITVKDVGGAAHSTTLQAHSGDTIDGSLVYSPALQSSTRDSITVFNNGTSWDVI
jgi:hypothetical protein